MFAVFTGVAGAYINLAYVGMALDRSRVAMLQAREAQAAEAARRKAAESNAEQLRNMLQERDHLAADRNQLLQVLAHEIRQPLHDASGALQSATLALQSSCDEGLVQAMHRVAPAESVLTDVHSVLDNTLAATRLMDRNGPLVLQEADLRLLVDLALGDLPLVERPRVQVHCEPGLLTAELEPGPVPRALRNLLRNAFQQGGPGTRVMLHITERDEPPSLWLSVADTGCGAPASVFSAGSAVAPVTSPHSAAA